MKKYEHIKISDAVYDRVKKNIKVHFRKAGVKEWNIFTFKSFRCFRAKEYVMRREEW